MSVIQFLNITSSLFFQIFYVLPPPETLIIFHFLPDSLSKEMFKIK